MRNTVATIPCPAVVVVVVDDIATHVVWCHDVRSVAVIKARIDSPHTMPNALDFGAHREDAAADVAEVKAANPMRAVIDDATAFLVGDFRRVDVRRLASFTRSLALIVKLFLVAVWVHRLMSRTQPREAATPTKAAASGAVHADNEQVEDSARQFLRWFFRHVSSPPRLSRRPSQGDAGRP
jgi:hypothetical protein